MNLFKHLITNCNVIESRITLEIGALGKTGELFGKYRTGQRARNTGLPSRDLVTGKRCANTPANGKEPKSMADSISQCTSGAPSSGSQLLVCSPFAVRSCHAFLSITRLSAIAHSNSEYNTALTNFITSRMKLKFAVKLYSMLYKRRSLYVYPIHSLATFTRALAFEELRQALLCGAEYPVLRKPIGTQSVFHSQAISKGTNMIWSMYKDINRQPEGALVAGVSRNLRTPLARLFCSKHNEAHLRRFATSLQQAQEALDTRERPLLGSAHSRNTLDVSVSEVISIAMKKLEPLHAECSHAFRADRSQHTCLIQIQTEFVEDDWLIIGDTTTAFAQMSDAKCHHLLCRTINDIALCDLVKKCVPHTHSLKKTTKYTQRCRFTKPLNDELLKSKMKLRDIMDNTVLHNLDMFILRLHPKMLGFENEAKCSFRSAGPQLHYTRYAHHFVIGISGSKKRVTKMLRIIERFLQERLTCYAPNTLEIKSLMTGKIPFLGYLLLRSRQGQTTRPRGRLKIGASTKCRIRTSFFDASGCVSTLSLLKAKGCVSSQEGPVLRRVSRKEAKAQGIGPKNHKNFVAADAISIRLLVNMPKVIHSLAEKGFCDRSGRPKPNFHYFQDTQHNTVARVASVLRGLSNYYNLADYKRRCAARWSYILTHSIAMMFAAKFKLRTRAKVFALAGRNLSKPLLAAQRKGVKMTK